MAIWIGRLVLTLLVLGVCAPGRASAAGGMPTLDGSVLSLWWVLPFAGLLLSVAVVPQVSPHFWHQHFGKVAAGWALLFLGPFAATYGVALAAGEVLHTVLLEYLPFVIVLFALFVISGGIRIRGNMVGTPAVNTGLLAIGTALASVTGTTGAAMLLMRLLDPGQPQAPPQCPRADVLHLPGRQHRRLADALGRPAAVPRLLARRRVRLDRYPHDRTLAAVQRHPARGLLHA